MSIKVTIDDRGIVQSKTTTSVKSVQGASPGGLIATTLSASIVALDARQPGFYYVDNVSTCSIGAAASYPGAEYIFSAVTGASTSKCNLTGSAYASTPAVVFAAPPYMSGTLMGGGVPIPFLASGSATVGACLKIDSNGSVFLRSDGRRWVITGCSGSVTLAAQCT